jgi:1,4-alpha-glucan branching enzyme
MTGRPGYLCLILHAHLPFVRHPEHPEFLEENWLYEAITDTYLPLLDVLSGLESDGARFRLTMTLTPSLLAMFSDALLRARYVRYIEKRIDLARAEEHRLRDDAAFGPLAAFYRERFERARDAFVHHRRNLTAAFAGFQDRGSLEIITCAAAHGFLPLLALVRARCPTVQVAVEEYRRAFGRRPRGSGCPVRIAPGLDRVLRDEDLRFFVMESHGVLHARPRPRFGVHAPVYCPSGVAAFGRDAESSKQVWSAVEGYPGNPDYREYYRDVGFDLDLDAIHLFLAGDGTRLNTGIVLRITAGPTTRRSTCPRARASGRPSTRATSSSTAGTRSTTWPPGWTARR